MNVETDLIKYQQRVNQLLTHYLLDPAPLSEPLHDAMRYAVLNGGKRLRPLLVYTLGTALGSSLESLDQVALIHDDLPSMDNDDWRRGKPSCHKKFGDSMALLAGDSLQALAFDVLLKAPLSPEKLIKMLNVLVKAAGPWGMVAGQAMEFSSNASSADKSSVFAAALELAGIVADLPKEQLLTLSQIGNRLGLVYQLQDDVCDNECSRYWQDPSIRETYLQGLAEQILKDLTFVPSLFSPKNKAFNLLLKTMFQSKEVAITYQ